MQMIQEIHEEMEEILSRNMNKASSVIITTNTKQKKFLVQRKTEDYHVRDFASTLCLFGGNSEKEDQRPLDTLRRELQEELPNISEEIIQNSKFFSTFELDVPIPNKPNYNFLSNVFVCEVAEDLLERFTKDSCLEGRMEIIDESELENNQFCWGYCHVFEYYLNTIDSKTKITKKTDILWKIID
eukprot:gene420-6831_t